MLTRDRLDELVPIEPAAMEDRQVIEWDKDDIDLLGFMKVDVLGLGMLSCMRRAFEFLKNDKGISHDLATIPAEDPATYAMIRKADTLGVFQIESRAQMASIPLMAPTTFYDLVIQVAIVRPGPIQGDMVHPYPMGFYAPAQIVRDARQHGVEVRPIDVNHSRWDCTLEEAAGRYKAVRLGLRMARDGAVSLTTTRLWTMELVL